MGGYFFCILSFSIRGGLGGAPPDALEWLTQPSALGPASVNQATKALAALRGTMLDDSVDFAAYANFTHLPGQPAPPRGAPRRPASPSKLVDAPVDRRSEGLSAYVCVRVCAFICVCVLCFRLTVRTHLYVRVCPSVHACSQGGLASWGTTDRNALPSS